MLSLLRDKRLLICGLSAFSGLSTYLLINGFKRLRESSRQGVLKLLIYPIKSLPGIEVDRLEICATGVKYRQFHDRAFMLLNEHNNLISLRTKPSLSLIVASFKDDDICLNAPGMPTLRISNSTDLSDNKVIDFNLWGQDVKGAEYSAEASAWFSKYLNSESKLVKFLPATMEYRKTDLHTDQGLVHDVQHPILYQDECAVALANQSSIDDLNSKLAPQNRVTYLNFRPNILVRQAGAFVEDSWKKLQIGTSQLQLAKPCHRCTTTTHIPERGVKNADFEPLETLKKYRIKEQWTHIYSSSPLFGISLSPTRCGMVSVGDQIMLV